MQIMRALEGVWDDDRWLITNRIPYSLARDLFVYIVVTCGQYTPSLF